MSERFGPNTAQVEAFLGVVRGLSGEQVEAAHCGSARECQLAVLAILDKDGESE